MITQELIKKYFNYKDGRLIWSKTTSRLSVAGTEAGTINKRGYRQICFINKIYKEHRLIYLYHYGHLPKLIDHIDGNKLNNKIENLRPATVSQNAYNAKLKSTNKSGVKGVSWDTKSNKWRAQCSLNGKAQLLGFYDTISNAKFVVEEYRNKYHKEFARHA
jgi:hypothetical protein